MVTRIHWLKTGFRLVGIPSMMLVALAGCKSTEELDAMYVPATHYERYPIEVAKGSVQVEIPSGSRQISGKNGDLLQRLAAQASSNAASPVVVSRPSGSAHGAAIAQQAIEILAMGGVDQSRIIHRTYGGGHGAPVVVSYVRTYAATKPCGDWSEDLTDTELNTAYPNFGCAQQHNIAAMVANPEDFIVPETETPSDPMRRWVVFNKYRQGDTTSAAKDQAADAAVSKVAK